MILIKSYTKFFIRHSLSNKGNVLISAISLILGITSALFMAFYVQHQLSYDAGHAKADDIYRVVMEVAADGESTHYAATGKPLGPILLKEYGEVEAYASFYALSGQLTFSGGLQRGGARFKEKEVYAVNKEVFKVFDLPLAEGSPEQALHTPYSIVLSQALAKKYFGDRAALGQSLEINGEHYQVTGVLQQLPTNSHMAISALLSEESMSAEFSLQDWFDLENYTYILLKDPAGEKAMLPKLKQLAANYLAPVMEEGQMKIAFYLQPLKEVHFSPGLTQDQPTGNKAYSYIFIVVAFLILIIACFNYINLSMALALKRGKEIGLRRVLGGDKQNLIQQLAFESFCMSLLSLGMSAVLIIYFFPVFKMMSGLEVTLPEMLNWKFGLIAAAMFFFVAMIGGIYPILYLARLEPVEALKNTSTARNNVWVHKTLLTVQFAASLIMVICTLVLRDQMVFLQERDLGFNRERLLLVNLPEDVAAYQDILRLKEVLEENDFVEGASLSGYGSLPGIENGKDVVEIRSGGKLVERVLNVFSWDDQVVDLLSIELIAGRNFAAELASDKQQGVLVNEQLVQELGWQDPLAEKISYMGHERQVVGVVKNFHFTSLHNKIEPAIIVYQNEYLQKLMVKVRETNLPLVETIWKQQLAAYPFEYTYLDDLWDSQYAGDTRLMSLFAVFSGLAILLACMGLLGLATFAVRQRKKEIGIRRVLGARFKDIFISISREFTLVVFLSVLIALPVAYYLTSALQDEFPYRAGISLSTYLFAVFALVSLVAATILYCVGRGLAARPIHTLKNE